LFLLAAVSYSSGLKDGQQKDNSFDLLIFTQHWPFTTCLDWEETRHGSCKKIENPKWTVHGLWPTQLHKIAPNFCNNSWPFDASSIELIKTEMATYWPDVEIRGVPNSLYEHEWTKHGTCACAGNVTGVKSQQDYFSTGCRLSSQNDVTKWLADAGIEPSDTIRLPMARFWDAVVAGAGTRPHIDCEKLQGEVLIKEIKLCFSKALERIDCDGIKAVGEGEKEDMVGSCLRYDSDILYPTKALSNKMHLAPKSLVDIDISTIAPSTPAPPSSSGLVVGVVCTVLALASILGYFLYRRSVRSQRGYESI